MKINSIKDYNKKIIINDSTLNIVVENIDYKYFSDDYAVNVKISIGELMLLSNINLLLIDNHDLLLHIGYKNI